ncbi:MAG TPA: 3'-5' exonuclease [Marinagarivorans sp.]
MAAIIPSNLDALSSATPGERRFGRRLEQLLEDDYTVWYDIPVGRQRRYPDFIVLHPARGLLFLEVKDWKINTLKRIDPQQATLETSSGQKIVANPLEQARQYANATVNQLVRDPQLINHVGRFRGNLSFPYGYGVVFTHITRSQWDKAVSQQEQEMVLPSHRIICQDEMTKTVDAEDFQSRLWGMFEYSFGQKLSLPQIDRIRWQLFPEVRINPVQSDIFAVDDEPRSEDEPAAHLAVKESQATYIPDIVRVMDIQQEQLAKSLGEGHRVIHGVAGSGKTLILGYRCLHLAQATTKPILVLCFNITLAAYLRSFIAAKGIEDKVQVYHFHDWCGLQLKTYNVTTLPGDAPVWERQVMSVIQAVAQGQIPRAQYGALMIDEGHDFERAWLSLVVQMIHPDSNSLLLLYDDAQSIYTKNNLKFPLSAAGIQARGRTTILKLNYRNTRQILNFAYNFAREYLQAQSGDDDHVPLIAPEVAGASGPAPAVREFASNKDEAAYIARCVGKWLSTGQALNDIAIIYTKHWQGAQVYRALKQTGIDCTWLKNANDKKSYSNGKAQVVLLTRQSSKGLEFDTVVLCGVGAVNTDADSLARETRLLYVGMTRARRQLLVTGAGENWALEQLKAMSTA